MTLEQLGEVLDILRRYRSDPGWCVIVHDDAVHLAGPSARIMTVQDVDRLRDLGALYNDTGWYVRGTT